MFGRRIEVISHRLEFMGEGVYQVALDGTSFGLVFEDNNDTGYLYVTNANFSEVHDALHIYDVGEASQLKAGEEAYIVWSSDLQKAGLYFRGRFQAGVNFEKQEARSRTGFPKGIRSGWNTGDHSWDDAIVSGLEP